jgi:hypothetical protein
MGGGTLVRVQQLSTAVPQAGQTNVLAINVTGISRIMVHCVVTGFALDEFQILGQPLLAPAQTILYSTTADYTSPKGVLIGTSGDLSLQAVGTGWFVMDTVGIDLVLVKASSVNVAGSTVSCYASGSV